MRIRPTIIKLMAALGIMVMLAGCYRIANYSGDGKLIDHGLGAATERYVLDLGLLPISTGGTRTYRIANLPPESFVLGIEVRRPSSSHVPLDAHAISATVLMQLYDDQSRTIMERQGPLRDWTWSIWSTGDYAFVYGRTPQGTFFTPEAKAALRLEVTVIQPDPSAADLVPKLVAKSGGWK